MQELIIKTDASFHKRTNLAGISMIIEHQNQIIHTDSRVVRCNSSVEAELRGVNWVIEYILIKLLHKQYPLITVCSDCFPVCWKAKTIGDIVNIRKELMHSFKNKIRTLFKKGSVICFKWIPRKENSDADKKSRRALKEYRKNRCIS